MFENSLVESSGAIRTRSRWTAVVSATAQVAAGTFFVLLPLMHPAVLRSAALNTVLLDPPRPHVRLRQEQIPALVRHATAAYDPMVYHPQTENRIVRTAAAPGSEPEAGLSDLSDLGTENPGAVITSIGIGPAPRVTPAVPPKPAAPSGPVRLSSGVAAGIRLSGAAPVYPQLALATRTSGHVMVEAAISKSGTIENAHVLSGPALLRQAALDAVATYRYRPFLVSGQPVDASFAIDINFTLRQ